MTLTDDEDMVAAWVSHRTGDKFSKGIAGAIGILRDGAIAAGVVFDHYTGPCVTATIAIDGRYLPRRLLVAMFNYAYLELTVNKIIVYINQGNLDSMKLAKQLGFTVEAEIKQVYEEGSMFILSLVKQNCVWIQE